MSSTSSLSRMNESLEVPWRNVAFVSIGGDKLLVVVVVWEVENGIELDGKGVELILDVVV